MFKEGDIVKMNVEMIAKNTMGTEEQNEEIMQHIKGLLLQINEVKFLFCHGDECEGYDPEMCSGGDVVKCYCSEMEGWVCEKELIKATPEEEVMYISHGSEALKNEDN